jgi:hypothetical protein
MKSEAEKICEALVKAGAAPNVPALLLQHPHLAQINIGVGKDRRYGYWRVGEDCNRNKVRVCWTRVGFVGYALVWKETEITRGKKYSRTQFLACKSEGVAKDRAHERCKRLRKRIHHA